MNLDKLKFRNNFSSGLGSGKIRDSICDVCNFEFKTNKSHNLCFDCEYGNY